jgi:hypothetical protein
LPEISAREALNQDRRVLGTDYGSACYHTRQQLWSVWSYWDRYETLYGTKERVSLLNESSGHFWYSIQEMLFDYILLGLCRLTDPPQTRGRGNLTLRRLYELEPGRYKAELRKLVDRAEALTRFARDWRNRRIAHNDLDLTISAVSRLAPATRKKVSKSLEAIHDVLRWITIRHFDSDMGYLPLGEDDANELMVVIDDGLAARRNRRSALERGDFSGAFTPSYSWLNTSRSNRIEPGRELKVPRLR